MTSSSHSGKIACVPLITSLSFIDSNHQGFYRLMVGDGLESLVDLFSFASAYFIAFSLLYKSIRNPK